MKVNYLKNYEIKISTFNIIFDSFCYVSIQIGR